MSVSDQVLCMQRKSLCSSCDNSRRGRRAPNACYAVMRAANLNVTRRSPLKTPPASLSQPCNPHFSSAASMGDSEEDPLALPPKQVLREIAAKQDAKEKEILERRRAEQNKQSEHDERRDAAEKIQVEQPSASTHDDPAHAEQRNYRGYRSRRELRGHGLTPTERWTEAVKTGRL
ncbi:hypothetical protein K461DRAFT_20802 [Myriangium duriaei CBS 260.36]|uniref:Uncharacterized protein n=1 Tax=Myriangium duriaei CBS 260.36 TaxID=1168546 RepID=A0A9P4MJW7_9PEZI|nr:hypothetical protein K461DRAFT_20802 [Myriangium duriaei CBS 260.36]